MTFENKEEYKEISILGLNLSTRTLNALMRAKCGTLYLMIEKYDVLRHFPNIGVKAMDEIDQCLDRLSCEGFILKSREEVAVGISGETEVLTENGIVLSKDSLERPVSELHISDRVLRILRNGGIKTVREALALSTEDFLRLKNARNLAAQQLQEQLEQLRVLGDAYFSLAYTVTDGKDTKYGKRELDTVTANELLKNYSLKTAWLCDWYGLSRQAIYNMLGKRVNRGKWRGKELLPAERVAITGMINEKRFYLERDGIRYYLVNNQQDNCAFLTVSAEDIKCFFLADLPEALRARVKYQKLYLLSEAECRELDGLGRTVYILKQPYFLPNDADTFKKLANARGMNTDEYANFLFGMSFCPSNTTVTDERIIAFLEENTVAGRTSIPSVPGSQWLRSFISRTPYSTEKFIQFYGFSTTGNAGKDISDFSEESLDTVEPDMRAYGKGDKYIEKLFSDAPLLGSRIIPEKTLEKIYQNSKMAVSACLNDSRTKLSMEIRRQVTLAVISYAKNWDSEDEAGFWTYITTQFGYRDKNGKLRGILCEIVRETLLYSDRWFISNTSGNQYKSSIVVHAFATKRSWLYFCDFLFDFYKTNLDWEYIEDDPTIQRMVLALRNKLMESEEGLEEDIVISSKVYNFREGIIKLIVNRPGYATLLVSSMLKRIDSLINHTNIQAATYEEQLCDEWMTQKLRSISENRKPKLSGERRNIAIDYTRIRPIYQLYNDNEVRIIFPDVRLAQNVFSSLRLKVICGGEIVGERALSYYGNELGKTMSGFSLKLEEILRRSGSDKMDVQIVILCDDTEIYNSGTAFHRPCLFFKGKNETDPESCEEGAYSVFMPRVAVPEFDSAEVSVIKENDHIRGYYVVFQKDFAFQLDGKLIALDRALSSGGVKILVSGSEYPAEYLENGVRFSVMTGKEIIQIIVPENENSSRYRLAVNSDFIDLDSLPQEESNGTRIYQFRVGSRGTDQLAVRLLDLSDNRQLFSKNLLILRGFSYRFNKVFYFSEEDFRGAAVQVSAGNGVVRQIPLFPGDERAAIPYRNGGLEIPVPLLQVADNENTDWIGTRLYWKGDIPQDRFLYVKAPAGISAGMTLNGQSIAVENSNRFALGNAIFGFSDTGSTSRLPLCLTVYAAGMESRQYELGNILVGEQFAQTPVLKYEEGRLSWDLGHGFFGEKTGNFCITICENTEYEITYPLRLEDEQIADGLKLPLGRYRFSIFKDSGNPFVPSQTLLASGKFYVGDVNELRFMGSVLQIDTITFEENTRYEAVKIRPSYLDHIEYQGVRFVPSEGMECPVYTGILYFLNDYGRRREYSYKDYTDEKGNKYYAVNPVRIIYINDSTLSLTYEPGDPEEPGDGFYYFRILDRMTGTNIYQLTDRDPTKSTKDRYRLADLYSYTKEGV